MLGNKDEEKIFLIIEFIGITQFLSLDVLYSRTDETYGQKKEVRLFKRPFLS